MQKVRNKHIGISGNIGAGKTALTSLLCKHYKWEAQYEAAEGNPYLRDFYESMLQWSFHLQIYFLQSRLRQHRYIQSQKKTVVQDRTIYEDAEIFARNLLDMKLMSKRNFDNYYLFYQQLVDMLRPPDLLIYLRCGVPKLVEQIQQRGRKFEENIRLNYLKSLNDKYESWVAQYNGQLLIIDMDEEDFVNNQASLGRIIRLVDSSIRGLF